MTVQTQTLADFLLARIAEDEADAEQLRKDLDRWRREQSLNGADGTQGSILAAQIAGSVADPARVVAECEAKRQLIAGLIGYMEGDYAPWNEDFLRLLALPYADHSDYREDWRP